MELLTVGSVPISWPSWASCWHMEGGGLAIVLTMGFLCPSNPQSKHYASKHAQTWFSFFPSNQKLGFLQKRPHNRLHILEYSEIKIQTYQFGKHLTCGERPLDFVDHLFPQDFLRVISRLLHIGGRGLYFVLGLSNLHTAEEFSLGKTLCWIGAVSTAPSCEQLFWMARIFTILNISSQCIVKVKLLSSASWFED